MTVKTDNRHYVEVTVEYTVTRENVEEIAKMAHVGYYFGYHVCGNNTVEFYID